jgi:hypothetical protein
MKSLSLILLCSIVFLCLVQAGAAVTSSGVTTSPPLDQLNALQPGYVISEVAGTINLPTSGSETFNSDDAVEFYTQLDNAKWSISIVIGGIENPARTFGGKHATIGGYDLSYPTSGYGSVALKFSMTEGTVPSSFMSGTITLVRVIETDPDSNQVGAAVNINGTVINTQALNVTVNAVASDITNLKTAIDAKQSTGVDVTIALQDYQTAKQALINAQTAIFSSPSQVQSYLNTATTNIDSAKDALDKASADYSIKQAQVMIDSVNGLITEFKVNDSLKDSDPRLVPIINKYDLAARSLSDAKNSFSQGSYSLVQSDAEQSLGYANDAWNLSLDLKTELGQGFQLPGLPNLSAFLPVLVVVVVVLIIAGVIIYRRKMHWDELG